MHAEALGSLVQNIALRMATERFRGRVPSYIPELASVDPGQFGIAVLPVGGTLITAGDAEVPFSIQSVSKVFSLTLALERVGTALWTRVGREPSGDPFNSIVQLEYEKGVPRNPFINAGAIVIADILTTGRGQDAAVGAILSSVRALACDDSVAMDDAVAASERQTSARNRALAQFIAAEGNLHNPVEDTLGVYFRQCSLAMSCRQLAVAGHYLAIGGRPGGDAAGAVPGERARRINALMMTCGCYDASGEVAYRVGLPCKSGVGGGMLAIAPGVASIAVWSPGLDEKGNSLLGVRALEDLAKATGWSVFGTSDRAMG